MIYLLVLEIKGLIKQFISSLDIKKTDYLFCTFMLLICTSIFKILSIFDVKLIYIVLGLYLLTLGTSALNNDKNIINLLKSKQYTLTRLYPLEEYKIVSIKVLRYNVLAFLQYVIIMVPLYGVLVLVGYNFFSILKYFIFGTGLFLLADGIMSLVNIYKSECEIKGVEILLNTITISIPYLFIYGSYKFFSVIVHGIENNGEFDFGILKSISIEQLLNNIINAKGFFIVIMLALMAFFVRMVVLLKVSRNMLKIKNKVKSNFTCKFNYKNILFKKEIVSLNSLGFFRYISFRISAYCIFAIICVVSKFNLADLINPSMFVLIYMYEIVMVCEKITMNYLGKEGGFVLHYMFSNYSILKIIKERSLIYIAITMIYIGLMEVIMGCAVGLHYSSIFSNFILSMPLIVVFIAISNIFNTFKTSYKNELAIPNKKVIFIKVVLNSLFSYLYLSIITFIPYIFEQGNVTIIQFGIAYFISVIEIIGLYIFTKLREGDFYGEFKNGFSKR